MSTTTTNLGLIKPELTDAADITAMNANWDKLDNNSVTLLNKVAVYYDKNSNKSADDLTDAFAIIPISDTVNSELWSILGGEVTTINFAYVITLFYENATLENNRMQLAFSYDSGLCRMAHRKYDNTVGGWLSWIRFIDNSEIVYKIYSNLESIGLVTGSETLKDIGMTLSDNSILICKVTNNNATIYPSNYGLLTVTKSSYDTISYEFITTSGVSYSAFYSMTSENSSVSPWRRNSSVTFSVTIPTNWIASGNYYYQDVNLVGITQVDEPIVDVLPNDNNDTTNEYVKALSKVFRITTMDGKIRLWSEKELTNSFEIRLKVV